MALTDLAFTQRRAAEPAGPPPAPRRLVERVPFRLRLGLVWLGLALLFAWFFQRFQLDYGMILGRLPMLLGLRLTASGGLQGTALTLVICAISMACCIALGVLVALARMSRHALPLGLATFYVSFFRGTPFLVQILLIYVGMPQVGWVPSAFVAGVLALSLNSGAYFSETVRAGIQSVSPGQREAAMSLGLSRPQTMALVVMPQAMRVILPPATSQFISMLKDSSLVSIMGLWEIMYLAQAQGRTTYRFMEMLLAAAIIYWLLSLVLELVQARLERRFARADRGT